MAARIVYARGNPYGAPLVMVRGGATRRDDVRAILRARGFRWNDSASAPHAWSTYLGRDDFADVLRSIAALGVEIVAKNPRSVVPGFDRVKDADRDSGPIDGTGSAVDNRNVAGIGPAGSEGNDGND